MRISFAAFLLCFFISVQSFSQELKYKVRLFSFFDNTEFGHSKVTIPQTMAGVHLAPEIGLQWDSLHRISAGFDLLHEFGSRYAIDDISPVAYYEFNRKPFRFMMGAFPRIYAIDRYPRMFFNDSITYYRPNMNGIFWEIGDEWRYLNLWLDWTSRQSHETREAFFMGLSGRYNLGLFYLRHFGYMFHFAGYMDPVVNEALHDNGLFLTSVGADLSGKTFLDLLDINAGWAAALDRARSDQTGWISHNGLLMELRAEYRKIGIFNTLYKGSGQMRYYGDHSNELYWGDPVYRAGSYARADFYINFINNRFINTRLVYSLHFLESNIYHEQSLKVSLNLNNF